MTTVLINPAELAELQAGGPSLLVLGGLDPAALALPGATPWLVTAAGDALRLHRPGRPADAASLALPLPPADVLAVIAPDAAAAKPLLAWWSATGPEPPPVLTVRRAEAALPGLARLALAALGRQAVVAAQLHRALVAARQDAEANRQAMVSLTQQAGRIASPVPPSQVLSLAPSPAGHAVHALEGRLSAGQGLGLPLEGLCSLAVHLHEAQVAPAGLLRLRLYGAESGQVHGAWLVPGEALAPGWLVLDLPGPIGPVRETACLDITAELEWGDALALSLEERLVAPERAAVVPGEPAGDRALAVRLWTAPFGRRFVLPQHWNAEAAGLDLAPPGVPARLPAAIWDGARFPAGQVEWVALGHEAPRLLASFGAGRRLAIMLPGVPVNGLDLLQAELRLGRGEPEMLEAALWLQPDGLPVATEADLTLEATEARWSGWRRAPADGGPLLLPMALPLDGPRSVTVALVLHHRGTAPAAPLRVEWSDLVGFRQAALPPRPPARNPLPAPPPAEPVPLALAPPVPRAAPPPPPPPPPAGPSALTVRLQEYFITPDAGYRHLDIWLEEVREAELSWPRLRFKLALRGEGPMLEFRLQPSWPAMFSTWPGAESDSWGPYLLVREGDIAGDFLHRLPAERDRRMLTTILRLLPEAVAKAVRESPPAAAEETMWLGLAGRLAAALGEPVA
ncbi:hypothetical protein JMJ55_16960 [Belnapia sp. T6]|uniref:Uncharacterized protein n=1 Tax=Belnapia mucosa TaxID=2804532 RepID=A0ABS1V9L3_9PROT|nr:DUF6212 domain-containing protein [Belnapia mucosa]MBL6457028.1 hypothetical protein [Belnapia mucosa]